MIKLENHILYESPYCPYCIKVEMFMRSHGITCEKRNTNYPAIEDELIRVGGKRQVPCLVIDGKALYESDDIIAYMREKIS